jgi:hypothetical protein
MISRFTIYRRYVVVDGHKSRVYDRVGGFIVSGDGKRYGFVGKKKDKFVVVVDGREDNKKYLSIEMFGFSPDSRHYGYIAFKKEEKGGYKYVIVVDGKEVFKCNCLFDIIWKCIRGKKFYGKGVRKRGKK